MFTYFGYLAVFLGTPLALIFLLSLWDHRTGRRLPKTLGLVPAWLAILVLIVAVLIYTSPWENVLVATGIRSYPPERVAGIVVGWVPIEEYLFFMLQSLLVGTWLVWLARRLPLDSRRLPQANLARWVAGLGVGLAWLAVAAAFILGGRSFSYLGYILFWALPPIGVQLVFGIDILWRCRRMVTMALITATLYLAATDGLAISNGIWRIDPVQSLGINLGGALPLEELVFFWLTNTLLVFGISLLLAQPSRERLQHLRRVRRGRK